MLFNMLTKPAQGMDVAVYLDTILEVIEHDKNESFKSKLTDLIGLL